MMKNEVRGSSADGPRRVAILGAGIAGLTAAWNLQRAGFSPVVFEKSSQIGGAIGAKRADGWLHELGPNSMLESTPEIAAFIDALGLGARRLYADPVAKQRYIVHSGSLVAMPAGPLAFAFTKLFSWRAKLALVGEPWRGRRTSSNEESVADFVCRRLGREFLDYAINPFVGGIYAGDPARLSVQQAFPKLDALEQKYGSLLRGAFKTRNTGGGPKGRMFSFPNGLEELPLKLAEAVGADVRLAASVVALRQEADGWHVTFESGGRRHTERFSAVISTLPADALAGLQFEGASSPGPLHALAEIVQPAVASVFIGYKRSEVRHPLDGFGMLVPAVESRPLLGTLFSSTLFPGRAPPGCVALTSFVGGMRDPELGRLNESELIALVHHELQSLLGVTGVPVYTHVKRWPRAIPQYELGYQRFKDAITAVEATAPGFFVGGNCRDGISLSNCLVSGQRLAGAASEWLKYRATAPLPVPA
jgi:oxygen-dependent protoporphyrinogen oxidase